MHDREPLRAALDAPGATVSAVARAAGVSRGTVRRARDTGPTLAETYRDAILAAFADWPWLTTPELADAIGWPGSLRHLSRIADPLRQPFTPGIYRGMHVGQATVGRATVGRATVGHAHPAQESE